MSEDDSAESRERHQRGIAAATGALLGLLVAGPVGVVIGAGLGPELEPFVRNVWDEISEAVKRRQARALVSVIEAGIPLGELEQRIHASDRTELLTGLTLAAAGRTAWEDKVRTLGRSLASGLLADDNAKIDVEQMIIAAITEIEGPQLALLELLTSWEPGANVSRPAIDGPLDLPAYSHSRRFDGGWSAGGRKWDTELIAYARPNLAPVIPSLIGTLQRHGLVAQNDNFGAALERYTREFEAKFGEYEANRRAGRFNPAGVPRVSSPGSLVPEPTWSPTELGEQVFLRFRAAGAELDDRWTSGPAPTDLL